MSASSASLRALAVQCRHLAARAEMGTAVAALNEMALDYDRQAQRADTAEVRAREMLRPRGPSSSC
jgi:hypothetical protein